MCTGGRQSGGTESSKWEREAGREGGREERRERGSGTIRRGREGGREGQIHAMFGRFVDFNLSAPLPPPPPRFVIGHKPEKHPFQADFTPCSGDS